MSKPRGLTVNMLKLYHGMHKASPSQLLVLPVRRPDFFQKRKGKQLYSNRNSFFPLVPDRYLMTYWLCDRIRRLQILFTFGPNNTAKAFIGLQPRPLASYADCESHETGVLGPEALITFPCCLLFMQSCLLKAILCGFVSSAPCVYTLSSSRVCLYFPALIKGLRRIDYSG